jgi:wobble nucleotide-excising tRNase
MTAYYDNLNRYIGAKAYENIAGKGFVEKLTLVDKALFEILRRLVRMRVLAIKSATAKQPDETESELAARQKEVKCLEEEINAIASLLSAFQETDVSKIKDELLPVIDQADSDLSRAMKMLEEITGAGAEKAKNDPLENPQIADWMNSLRIS